MNRSVRQNELSETIAQPIWEGKAIMGTAGSVKDPVATYSFVIHLPKNRRKTSVKGCGFLPPTAQYLDPYSKHPKEAAALLAGLTWIHELLKQYPNHTGTNPHPLLIPIDNDVVLVKDVHRIITNAQTPTYDLLSPDFDNNAGSPHYLPIRTDIAHIKGHQDRTKLWHELDLRAKCIAASGKICNQQQCKSAQTLSSVNSTTVTAYYSNQDTDSPPHLNLSTIPSPHVASTLASQSPLPYMRKMPLCKCQNNNNISQYHNWTRLSIQEQSLHPSKPTCY
jgi:hypothetical protein